MPLSANETDELGTRLRGEPRPLEQHRDALGGVLRRGQHLDAQPTAPIGASPNEAGLLEHPDEDATVALGGDGGQVVGLDRAVRGAERFGTRL